jgi:hypothetical protein
MDLPCASILESSVLPYSKVCPLLVSAIFIWKKNPKVAGRDLNRSEMEVLKEGLDGFSYFV